MTNYFKVKNFEQFQHYKDRSPPWIKLYNELLDDYEFCRLQDASKMHLIGIWLLASRSDNHLPYDAGWIGKRISATGPVDLGALAAANFIIPDQPLQTTEQVASAPLAERQQTACLEERRGETEKRQRQNDSDDQSDAEFEQFWSSYPRKVGKGQARKVYSAALKKPGVTAGVLLAGVLRYRAENQGKDPQYIRYPTTWLTGEGWNDEAVTASKVPKPGNMLAGSPEWHQWRREMGIEA